MNSHRLELEIRRVFVRKNDEVFMSVKMEFKVRRDPVF